MIRTQSLLFRIFAGVLILPLTNISMPASIGTIASLSPKSGPPAQKQALAPARSGFISAREAKTSHGLTGANPYLAGQNKWDINYKGIDLLSGNFTTRATDLTFEGGYGIPVNVTRSYSANSTDEGPFGQGWSLGADVRSTAGGVLKSKNAPIRSVPVSFKERPSTELDPNVATQPVEAVISEDAGGKDETNQRDADGILTTPPWDKNVINSGYEVRNMADDNTGGPTYTVLVASTVTTIDGTVYTYAKKGIFPSGQKPYNNPGATPECAKRSQDRFGGRPPRELHDVLLTGALASTSRRFPAKHLRIRTHPS